MNSWRSHDKCVQTSEGTDYTFTNHASNGHNAEFQGPADTLFRSIASDPATERMADSLAALIDSRSSVLAASVELQKSSWAVTEMMLHRLMPPELLFALSDFTAAQMQYQDRSDWERRVFQEAIIAGWLLGERSPSGIARIASTLCEGDEYQPATVLSEGDKAQNRHQHKPSANHTLALSPITSCSIAPTADESGFRVGVLSDQKAVYSSKRSDSQT